MNYISGIATNSHPDTQGPTIPTSGDGNGPTDTQPNVPNTEGQVTGNNPTSDRAADLDYPDIKPPDASSHLHGQFELSRYGNLEWMTYATPLSMLQLPKNIVMDDEHWVDRVQPDGTIYRGVDQSGQ